MRKILLGISVLFSLAFLAACGSGSNGSAGSDGTSGTSGSTGSTGATGDTGATGADGSIAVPSADSDLAISDTNTGDTVDNNTTLGTVTLNKTISGLDNTTAMDDRLRYYMYEGTSATAKAWVAGDGNTIILGTNGPEGSDIAGLLDPREMTTDNLTVTMASYVLNKADGTISHLIVCPGNEAGDATTCASEALKDRGSGTAGVVTSGEGAAAAAKAFFVLPYSTANFVSIRDNTSDVRVYNITDTKATAAPAYGSTIAITGGTTGSGNGRYTNAGTLAGGAGTGHSVDAIESNGVFYYATLNPTDNISGAIYKYTTSASAYLDNITAANSSAGAGNNLVLAGTDASANDTIFAVANHYADNTSISAYRISVGDATAASTLWGTDNLTLSGDNSTRFNSQVSLCADARYMSASGANTRDASTDNATLFIGYRSDNLSWVIDSNSSGGAWSTGIYSAASSDNTSEAFCAMTVTKHGNDNGTLYMAAKTNTTVYTIYKMTGLNSLVQGNLSAVGTVTVSAAGPVDIGFDTDDNSTVVLVNDNGNVELWRNNETAVGTFTNIVTAVGTSTAGDRVSLAVQPSKYAVGSMTTTDNASVRIFYDE
jgi:hypothetical protein